MSRMSGDEFDKQGNLVNGFDYDLQVWVINYIIQDCGHPSDMQCDQYCNSHKYAGQDIRTVNKQ